MRKKDYSFDESKLGTKVVAITSIVLIMILTLALVLGGYFFGLVGFFNLFNVEYDSFTSLFLFITFFIIFSFLTDLFAKAFLVVLAGHLKSKRRILVLKFVLELLFSWLALFVVDEMMISVMVPVETELAAALLVVITDLLFDGKKASRKKDECNCRLIN